MSKEFDLVQIRLFKGDRERLKEIFPTVGYNAAIRQLVRTFIRKFEEKEAGAFAAVMEELEENA